MRVAHVNVLSCKRFPSLFEITFHVIESYMITCSCFKNIISLNMYINVKRYSKVMLNAIFFPETVMYSKKPRVKTTWLDLPSIFVISTTLYKMLPNILGNKTPCHPESVLEVLYYVIILQNFPLWISNVTCDCPHFSPRTKYHGAKFPDSKF